MLKNLSGCLLPAFLLVACSTMPSGPSVLVLPGTGKDFAQFHNDESMCRQAAASQIASSKNQPDDEESQQAYDIVYIQCMYGKGHRVPVPGNLMYETRQEWHPPPPPNMPPPARSATPPGDNSAQ